MRNILVLLLSIVLVMESNSQKTCEEYGFVSYADEDFCRFLPLPNNSAHCCYVPEDTDTSCWALTDDEYENIKKAKDYFEYTYGIEDMTIECSAKIIYSSLFILFSLFGLLY